MYVPSRARVPTQVYPQVDRGGAAIHRHAVRPLCPPPLPFAIVEQSWNTPVDLAVNQVPPPSISPRRVYLTSLTVLVCLCH
jgi:hypothetical protein